MALTVNVGASLPHPSFGENLSRLSNIPFWGGYQTDEKPYETTFRQDFKSFASLIKRAAIHHPSLAKVEHKDLQHIREYETEVASSFTPHRLSPLSRIPAWTKLTTNLKMHSDQRYKEFHTTQAESFQHLPMLSAVPRPVHLFLAASMKQGDDKLPETTQRASYVSHKVSPVVRADRKHQDAAPGITGDRKRSFFSSSYNDAFQYRWSTPPPTTETQFHSSLVMGDKDKISESETTHSASFHYTGAQSPVLLKKRLHVNLGDLRDHEWTTTTSEAFNAIKPEQVHIQLGNVTLSSIPRGDTDTKRNQERSTTTTNRVFFSEENHKHFPVRMDNPSLRTKSNVEFGRLSMAGMFYSTTAQESYPHKYAIRVKPRIYPSGRVLADQEPGPAVTTVQSDYVPLNTRRRILNPEQLYQIKASHIRPPNSEFYFTTTHKEAFSLKPKSKVSLDNPPRQHFSHMQF
ncbi:uncharacterized protein si:dkey-13m1.5 [Pangasianodon hypophthalmus]|uniref:uncharacterized protein si:dkey-13m1.5 n=1 Tax=Pangasianodon hypophthalmus TaxID=310915 RepID=UPI002306DE7E|nr:uncharacterized protein si:dkey-13m1.5 [Pangasianodon hypophthalmus]XP_053094050.1 uncharacterized protein si:dkey-13m1.5 [Pangasianodon hypophthalmus]